jgi:hypothetical protein
MNIYDSRVLIIAGIIMIIIYYLTWRKNKKEKRLLDKFDKIDTSRKVE